MYQIVLTTLLLVPLGASAQVGTVRYTHTYPVLYSHYYAYRDATSDMYGDEFVAPPTHATVSRSMVFDTAASLMYPTDKPYVELGDRKIHEGEEHNDTVYVNLSSGAYTESRAINWGVYLVSDQQPAIPWRLEDEERVYLDRRVMKATAVVDSAAIEAWFTPEVPIPAGPGLYGGLPGLILMVTNMASGEVYAADSLVMGVLARTVVPPTGGRKTSDKEYRRIRDAEIAEDRRLWEWQLRLIEEGKVVILKRRGQ